MGKKLDWAPALAKVGRSLAELEGRKLDLETLAREIVDGMTLRQKCGQMSGNQSLLIGGPKMLWRYNAKPIPASEDRKLGVPGFYFTDGPRGVVMNSSTCFPASMARGATFDVRLEERVGDAIGKEARAQGANFFGGVCVNLLRHPAWGRAQETYGEDPFHLGEMGAALVRGVQRHALACVKHYACNSIENARFKVDVRVDERTLREVYLPHFRRCVEEGAASVMTAYNKVNGHYCGHNTHLIRDVLKGDWGFDGFVISDFLFGVRDAVAAVEGGMDVEMPFRFRMRPKKLVKLVERGTLDASFVDEAALRVVRTKLRFAWTNVRDPARYPPSVVGCREHADLALEVARKGTVLLKNEGTLPLDPREVRSIAVLGKLARLPNVGDKGSSRVYPRRVVTPLEGLRAIASELGVDVKRADGKDLGEAKALSERCDAAVVVVGYTHRDEGEYVVNKGGDRVSLRLRPEDEELVKAVGSANQRCVVVVEGGSAVVTEAWREQVPAILMAWYPGQEGGTALAEILFGRINPSGKLPVTFPKSEDQLPFFDRDAESIEYGYYHGYRLFQVEGREPAFPFGHGLSYASFSVGTPRVDPGSLSRQEGGSPARAFVEVVNEGSVAGDVVVQLYADVPGWDPETRDRALRGFQRVCLSPGESEVLEFSLAPGAFSWYNVERGGWVVDPGRYGVHCGTSSREEDLRTAWLEVE
ncbi:MAG: glycoside hydrolase family 3 C-terminal domain-containing protein [Promethearchaeota archaeon]